MVNSVDYTKRHYAEKQDKRLKSINSKSNLNRHEGILIKTNTHLLKNIRNLEGALQNQRSQCKADLTSN